MKYLVIVFYAIALISVCITGYSGLDPEVNSDPDKAKSYPTLGLDWGAYMRARTFTVGLNVEF